VPKGQRIKEVKHFEQERVLGCYSQSKAAGFFCPAAFCYQIFLPRSSSLTHKYLTNSQLP